MAQLQSVFNAQQFDPTKTGGFQQLPLGKQPVVIVASEIKATKEGDGGMIVYQLQIIDGPHRGAEGPYYVNLYSAKDKTRAIAESQQSALCHVTGVFLVQDTAQLHNIPFIVDVTEQMLTLQQLEKKNNGEQVTPFTQVSKVYDIQGNEPKGGNAAPAQKQQQPAAQAPASATGAWGAAAAAAPAPAASGGWSQAGASAAGSRPAWGAK